MENDLQSLHEKLDRILEFQEKLLPYLPLLGKAATFIDNPVTRYREAMRSKKEKTGGS